MVPKVAARGTSFKGAGLYYLHDKRALTAERVEFTLTENLPTVDAELALRYMAYTAMRQNELKAASGQVMTGRKLSKTVYTYSLAWSPEEEPTRDEMIEAARDTLTVLGIQEHEALFVAHNDEPHPHIHVIVNRVHPGTGLAAKLSNDHLTLSRWAEAYEKRQGKIRCEQRVENNEKRRNGQFVKDTKSWNKAAFHRDRRLYLKGQFDRRQIEKKNLSAYHLGQRQALYDEKEARIALVKGDVRESYRLKWASLYRRQDAEKRELREASGKALSRLRYWLRHRKRGEHGFSSGPVKAFFGRTQFHKQLAARHEAERKALAKEVYKHTHDAIAQENKAYHANLGKLKKLQRGETEELQQAHSEESQHLAREIVEESARRRQVEEPGREGPPDAGKDFRDAVARRIRKARKRDERGKDHGHDRD